MRRARRTKAVRVCSTPAAYEALIWSAPAADLLDVTDMPHLERWHQALCAQLTSLMFPRQREGRESRTTDPQEFGVLKLIAAIHDPDDVRVTKVLIRDVEQAILEATSLMDAREPEVCFGAHRAHERH